MTVYQFQPQIKKWQCPFCDFRLSYPLPGIDATEEEKATFENMWEAAFEKHFHTHVPEREA